MLGIFDRNDFAADRPDFAWKLFPYAVGGNLFHSSDHLFNAIACPFEGNVNVLSSDREDCRLDVFDFESFQTCHADNAPQILG